MPHPATLPPHLREVAFKTSDVEFHGLTRGRLRSRDIAHPFHGISVRMSRSNNGIVERCRAYAPLLRDNHVFSHTTAALLHGMPLPKPLEDDPTIHVSVLGEGACPRTRGVVGHRLRGGGGSSSGADAVLIDDLPVVAPADTWCQLAPLLTREDLVAVGDYLVSGVRSRSGRSPICSREALAAARNKHARRRGMADLDWALERIRWPVDSRPESLLRLLLVAAGFPEPIPNDPTPVDGGSAVLHPDLKWPEYRILFEYEGDGHREDVARFRADINRKERFEAAGWRVIRVVWDDLTHDRDAFLERVRRTIEQQLRVITRRH